MTAVTAMRIPTRIAGLLLAALIALPAPALAQDEADEDGWLHAISLDNPPRYEPGFPHFDYVDPDAPKGGTVRLSELGGFDTFNPVLPQGEPASGLGLVYESLLTPSMDEISTQYGLIAEALRFPPDFSSVTFRLDADARWHDGEPITPEDVVWSFEKLVELNPSRAYYYANVTGAEITGEREVTFTFDEAGNRELPYIMGQLVVLPRHWWEGEGPNGEPRDIAGSTLEPPLGSGPYRLDGFVAGRTVSFTRVEDAWAADHPVNVGHYNFDTLRYEYFRDNTVEFEAFKADQFDWWNENIARRWATGYDFPAAEDGRVVKELFENPYRDSGLMVGFIYNTRRDIFQDPLVREALAYAFDFEELNRTIFFEQYDRIDSYFFGSDLASEGLPEGLELEILEEVRDLIPERVFTQEYTLPVGGTPEALRDNLRAALALLSEAGYSLDGNRLVDETGRQLGFEILLNGPTVEVIALHLQGNLAQIGIDATIRTADSSQFINRMRSRDYDVIYQGWAQSLSPGNEQRDYWGSSSADQENSGNYAGISDPGIDALINRIIFAEDRETLEAATRALDRVLLAHHFVLPTYTIRTARIARWDRFGHPDELPEYAIGFPSIWWWDEDRAARIGGGN